MPSKKEKKEKSGGDHAHERTHVSANQIAHTHDKLERLQDYKLQ
jgi:hypothetical protein